MLLDGHCLIILERTLRANHPEENCALLIGRHQGTALQLQQIWPCCNCWEPAEERLRRFCLDPREQLLAEKWCRARQLQVLGAAHSHPGSAAVPSATDRTLCVGPTLMVIRTGLKEGVAALRCWWMPANACSLDQPRELRLKLLPQTG